MLYLIITSSVQKLMLQTVVNVYDHVYNFFWLGAVRKSADLICNVFLCAWTFLGQLRPQDVKILEFCLVS